MKRIKQITYIKQDLEGIKKWLEKWEQLSGKPEEQIAVENLREWGQQLLGDTTSLCTLLDEMVGTDIYG